MTETTVYRNRIRRQLPVRSYWGGGGVREKLFKHERTFYETGRTEAHERSEADYTYTQTFPYKYIIIVVIIIIDLCAFV